MVEFFSGLTYSPDNVVRQPGTLVLRSSNVQNGEIVDADNVYVNNEVVNSDNVQVGDLAVVVRNGSRNLIGKHAAIKYPMKDTVIGAFMTGVRSDTPSFTNALLDSKQFEVEIEKNLGATINQITTGNFKKMTFNFPKVDERLKIGGFFNQLDNTIALHQRQLDFYKEIKKAMLQNMFPREGEKVPEVRFADFSEPWEQRNLGDLSESLNYGLNASATNFDGENKYIRITDIDDKSHRFIQHGLTTPNFDLSNADDYLLREDDVLFARTGASVGKTYQYNISDGKVYFAGFLIRARIRTEFNSSFIFQNTLTSTYQNFIKITSQRSGQPGVNAQEYANFSILVPIREEQNSLGDFFKQLDDTVTLHQQKTDKMQSLKNVLLSKMFI
jgi:type I restriction enzyme, S subunit